ncbi:MAG TPA: DegT/DnrJ/EryC1/StrS family aminotransferase [Actinophytocola sp.]|uniref:DegT/DnrJ/EryC1/StrS family aminotransferase n=1 Tax=Actinophytocola sp. TaxID=1872138 RepID=UPI002DDD0AA3|nr:DegT/DnrJ/EryC1/StrS family aminotransferase [Actinophytocola sp.]HEV2783361.1 DegT/DnrJ/EryC1/StrS family aminotransferase [Actinophytocola sp.]
MLAINGGTAVVRPGTVAPWPVVTDDDRRAVLRALDLGTPWRWPIEPVVELERAWARFTGMPHVLAANSGTAALHMCVAACDVEPGDEVIVPADTFLASASCVLQANAIPVFVDVDPVTYTIDPAKVEERITDRTKAVIAVDLNGLPADYDPLRGVTRRHGLALIEDGAQAHGATYKGRPVGSLGDAAGCSLNGSKPLSALGEGGLFSTDDERRRDHAARVLMFGEDEGRGRGGRDYNSRLMGWNYRMDLLAAAFATSQLERLPELTERRRANGDHLSAVLAGLPGIRTPVVPDYATHVYFFYPIMVEPEALDLPDVSVEAFRVALKKAMAAEGVLMQEWQPRPVPAQTLFQEQRGYGRGCPWTCGHARPGVRYEADDYPVAADICRRRLVLGQTFSSLAPPNDTALMDRYGEAFHKVLVEHRPELYALAKTEQAAR